MRSSNNNISELTNLSLQLFQSNLIKNTKLTKEEVSDRALKIASKISNGQSSNNDAPYGVIDKQILEQILDVFGSCPNFNSLQQPSNKIYVTSISDQHMNRHFKSICTLDTLTCFG